MKLSHLEVILHTQLCSNEVHYTFLWIRSYIAAYIYTYEYGMHRTPYTYLCSINGELNIYRLAQNTIKFGRWAHQAKISFITHLT